ncbi:MAG: DUF3795 domain-containing protein [Methanomassiliicoccaceae archaeon]|nr:DUF3795 domain-containing protein [Methanomassiliicoccaceae archaeon]
MEERYICYCGLYCGNCSVKARIGPAAKALYDEMIAAGFEDIIQQIPGGDGFWPFLRHMAEVGICISCREGGGDPECAIRKCAVGRGVDMCAFCESYPCGHFDRFSEMCPVALRDNELLREKGVDAWSRLQDERCAKGFVYQDGRE